MTEIEFQFSHQAPACDLLVLFLFKEGRPSALLDQIDTALHGGVRFNREKENFEGAKGQILTMTTNGYYPIRKIMLVGLGEEQRLSTVELQEVGGQIAAEVKERAIAIDASNLPWDTAPSDIAFGMLLRGWDYKKHCKNKPVKTVAAAFLCTDPQKASEFFCEKKALYEGVAMARDLTVEPANILFPEAFAKCCLSLQDVGIKVQILDEQHLQALGAEAVVSVGKGSIHPPRMVVMQWNGGPVDAPPIALAGKGVCFDTGGVNIKTTQLLEMKWDKAGAGAVTGIMYALAKQKAPINVVGIIGLAENMLDGASTRPGDIISTLAEKTVEIVDTDCEGRLVLADCLWYVQEKFQPSVVIDLATLNPETCAALAGVYAGLYCEDDTLSKQLIQAGKESGEKVWPLPMGEAFAKQIESPAADLKNMGIPEFGEGGAAAEFLKCFIKKEVVWAHIDIAGVAWTQEDGSLNPKGVTGFGVRLLHQWIQNLLST
jgi:leucyl aminopeptidase